MPAAGTVVEIRGLDRLRLTLKRAGADLADMKAANTRVAEMVRQWAAVKAPRRSGALADSLRPARQVARARVTSALVYAPVIHWGWPAHNIKAQEFLVQAAVDTQPAWLDVYEKELVRLANSVQGA
jgi:ammonia channel protein AmtB